jgi:hypothetical protein
VNKLQTVVIWVTKETAAIVSEDKTGTKKSQQQQKTFHPTALHWVRKKVETNQRN